MTARQLSLIRSTLRHARELPWPSTSCGEADESISEAERHLLLAIAHVDNAIEKLSFGETDLKSGT